MLRALALAVALCCVGVLPAPSVASAAEVEHGPVTYQHPVEAAVVDEFRPPLAPWGPGNRGIDYATGPGDPVRAAAAGVVRFAGQVGGDLHVTLEHVDGRLTSYSFLGEIRVLLGQQVWAGEVIALAGGPLHVGVRENGAYVDPAALFDGVITVRLVPESTASGSGWTSVQMEAARFAWLSGSGQGVLGGIGRLVGGTVQRAFEVASVLMRAPYSVLLFGWELHPLALGARILVRGIEWFEQLLNCTPGSVAPNPLGERRLAVLVAGLGSSSDRAAVGDLPIEELGYEPGYVIGFSYLGGRVPGRFGPERSEVAPELEHIAVNPYGSEDSERDLRARGALLADLLEEVVSAAGEAPVDVYAHSQGGIVVRLALQELRSRPGGERVLASLGVVATMGTPHQGADLASVALAARSSTELSLLLAAADRVIGTGLDPRVPNASELAVGSPLVRELAAESLPEGPSYLSIGARGDLTVPDARTRWPGAERATVPLVGPSAHSEMVSHPATVRELGLALAGAPPTCRSLADFLGDLVVSEAIHLGTNLLGVGAAAASLASPLSLGLF